MTIYSLDELLFLFGSSLLFHVQFYLLLPEVHTGFSKAGQVVWYAHLLKNFPQFIVIHTVKGFEIVNKAEVDVFLKFAFPMIQLVLAILSLLPLTLLNPACTSRSSRFMYC